MAPPDEYDKRRRKRGPRCRPGRARLVGRDGPPLPGVGATSEWSRSSPAGWPRTCGAVRVSVRAPASSGSPPSTTTRASLPTRRRALRRRRPRRWRWPVPIQLSTSAGRRTVRRRHLGFRLASAYPHSFRLDVIAVSSSNLVSPFSCGYSVASVSVVENGSFRPRPKTSRLKLMLTSR